MAKFPIKRKDYNRVLVTETLPFETPIVFSNDGLYRLVADLEALGPVVGTVVKALVFGEGIQKPPNSTIPCLYKIRKGVDEFRRLALLHPSSQWKIREFYEKFDQLILYYCSISSSSIRAPRGVAGSFYTKSSWENLNRYKNGAVTIDVQDKYVKHSPSYFSYRGFDRLYKFFGSQDFYSLEKNFSVLRTLDVSKCFDSIYTHCLSWAVKDKNFTKSHVLVSSTFGQEFDEVIRHGNHNETNGIPIGPEVSRIFAEILFQEVDRRVLQGLRNLRLGEDFEFRRYVDDLFIFAKTEAIANKVYGKYADVLLEFNMHANSAKSNLIKRPFLTNKSRLIFESSRGVNEFFDKFLDQINRESLVPRKIYSQWKLARSFVESLRSLCAENDSTYDDISSFLISAITERIKKLVNSNPAEHEDLLPDVWVGSLEVLLDVLFFLYSVAPSVGASYKLSASIILSHRFVKQHLPEYVPVVSQRIFDLAVTFLERQSLSDYPDEIDSFVHLESLNVMLAVQELGNHYLLPVHVLERLFVKPERLSYFTIVSVLFYVRDNPFYSSVRDTVLKAVVDVLRDMSDIFMSAEKAYLLLDMLACPFVSESQKKKWIKSFYSVLKKTAPSGVDLSNAISDFVKAHAQVDWSDVDLLNSLEKKELKQAY
jgi:hypothetical protein